MSQELKLVGVIGFPYQGKCLAWLRDACAALAGADREGFDTLIRGTGCEAIFDD